MTMVSSARSDVGRVRLSNQDSGYAGTYLFIVADGMGGHAGGDVASGIAVRDLATLDRAFDSLAEAKEALVGALLTVNSKLSHVVVARPELAGLGTTVSMVLRVGERYVTAHIGDSRIYRVRGGDIEQVTKDHTFVQQLIDSGRITEAEAKDHPRRSVLMRVLGDVDAEPLIDTGDLPAVIDDWLLLCSDGLTTVLDDNTIASVLETAGDPASATARLVDLALAAGAPDNVTVIVVRSDEPNPSARHVFVGSASSKRKLPTVSVDVSKPAPRTKARTVPVTTSELPLPPPAESAVEVHPDDDIRHHRIRRRFTAIIVALVIVGILVVSGILAYRWTQTRYYVGVESGHVAVFQGVPVTFAGIALSHLYQSSSVSVTSLSAYDQSQVEQTIAFDNAADALDAVNRLGRDK